MGVLEEPVKVINFVWSGETVGVDGKLSFGAYWSLDVSDTDVTFTQQFLSVPTTHTFVRYRQPVMFYQFDIT